MWQRIPIALRVLFKRSGWKFLRLMPSFFTPTHPHTQTRTHTHHTQGWKPPDPSACHRSHTKYGHEHKPIRPYPLSPVLLSVSQPRLPNLLSDPTTNPFDTQIITNPPIPKRTYTLYKENFLLNKKEIGEETCQNQSAQPQPKTFKPTTKDNQIWDTNHK